MLIRLAGIAVLLISAAGCPSSDDEGNDPDAASSAVPARPSEEPAAEPHPPLVSKQPTTHPGVEPEPPGGEPGPLPDVPGLVPIVKPDRTGGEPSTGSSGQIRQTVGNPGVLPNPLRNGNLPAGANTPAGEAAAHKANQRPGKHRGQPFDPVKENGPIFVGWPQPKLALLITGRQEGYLEPCGCAGLDRMKGGMSRRHTLFKTLRNDGWPLVGIDVGGLAKGYGRQAELKFHITVEGMRKMGYEAIALGMTDLRLPTGELFAVAASVEGQHNPFLSANVGLIGSPGEYTAQTRIVEAAGVKLGITSVLGKKFRQQINNDEIVMTDPESALAKVVPGLKQGADYLILLAHAGMDESLELAGKFPDFDLVVTAGGASEPPANFARIGGGKTLLIEVGEKGMDAIVLGMFDDPKQPFRYQRVPLDSRFPASPEMKTLMEIYQAQLQREWLEKFAIGKIPHPQKELGGTFVGSQKCVSCHEPSHDVWKKSRHAKAYETLLKLDPPRNFDPECVSCHVIGWHPTDYYPYQGGYQSPEKTPTLLDVGCESCHGPGEAHVAAEMGSDEALQKKLQQAVAITKEEAADPRSQKQHCFACHDGDNSPDFDFESYWPYVEHQEESALESEEQAAGGR